MEKIEQVEVKRNFDIVSDGELGGVIFAEALKRVHESRVKGSFESELNSLIDEAATMKNMRTHLFVREKVDEFRKKKGEAISRGRSAIKDKKKSKVSLLPAPIKDLADAVNIGQAVHLEAARMCKKDKTQNYNFHLHNAMVKYENYHHLSKEFVGDCVSAYWASLKDINKNKVSLASQPTIDLKEKASVLPSEQPILPVIPSPSSPLSVIKLYRLWIENNPTVPCDSFFYFFGLMDKPTVIDDLKNMRTVMAKEGYEFESVPGMMIIQVVKRPESLEELALKLAEAKNNNDREAYTEIIKKLISATPSNALPNRGTGDKTRLGYD